MAEQTTKLAGYTVQQLQLELIRRSSSSNGEALVQFLLEHQALWSSVMLNDTDFYDYRKNMPGLMKLTDLEYNTWRADTLYVMVRDEAAAHQFIRLGEDQNLWKRWQTLLYDAESSSTILGIGRNAEERVVVIGLR